MAVKKTTKKPQEVMPEQPSPIEDYLDRRERNKYGTYVVKGEVNYNRGDMSRLSQTYGYASTKLESMRAFMSGGLRKGAK